MGLKKSLLEHANDEERQGVRWEGRCVAHPELHEASTDQDPSENQADGPENNPQIRPRESEGSGNTRGSLCLAWGRYGQRVVSGPIRHFRLDQKAVSPPGDRLDIKRLVGGIAQGHPQLVHGGIHIGIVIDVSIRRPQPRAQFLSGDDFAGLFQQCKEGLIDLSLKLQSGAVPGHLLALLVNPKGPEMDITA